MTPIDLAPEVDQNRLESNAVVRCAMRRSCGDQRATDKSPLPRICHSNKKYSPSFYGCINQRIGATSSRTVVHGNCEELLAYCEDPEGSEER